MSGNEYHNNLLALITGNLKLGSGYLGGNKPAGQCSVLSPLLSTNYANDSIGFDLVVYMDGPF